MSEGEKTKTQMPDGKGGWVEVDALKFEGQKQDPEKAQQAMADAQKKDFFIRVGRCTEALNKYLKMYARDHGLEIEEVIAAVYLENCNNRYYFPEDKGGKEGFDAVTQEVWNYFKEAVQNES